MPVEALYDLPGMVGRTVVGNDDFKIELADCGYVLQRSAQGLCAIVGGNTDTDLAWGHRL